MRNDQPHAPAHLVIDEPLLLVSKYTEQRKAGRGLVQRGGQMIDEALKQVEGRKH